MALEVTTTGTGGSSAIELSLGRYILLITWAGSAGDADLQVGDGTSWVDVEDASGVVNMVADKSLVVPGGAQYRLDVNTHTSAATMKAIKTEDTQ